MNSNQPNNNETEEPLDAPQATMEILDLDHPGAKDPDYRVRREHIATLAREYRANPNIVPTLEYTADEHATWREVSTILNELHPDRACGMYLRAKNILEIPTDHIPQMRELSERIRRFNGMRLGPVEGLIDSRSFLVSLANKRMFCTQYVRHHSRPTFSPEPDIIHEVQGHAPTFADADFVEFSRLLGEAARAASDEELKQIERLYWFTLEYGMIEEKGKPKAFGAGLLAGIEDMNNAFKTNADIRPFVLDEVINTEYNYSFMQDKYFIIPSFEFLKEETARLLARFNNEKK